MSVITEIIKKEIDIKYILFFIQVFFLVCQNNILLHIQLMKDSFDINAFLDLYSLRSVFLFIVIVFFSF